MCLRDRSHNVPSGDSLDSFHERLLGEPSLSVKPGAVPQLWVLCATGGSDLTFLGLYFPIYKMETTSGQSGACVKSVRCGWHS